MSALTGITATEKADLGEVVDDPLDRDRQVVVDLDDSAVRPEPGLEPERPGPP